ncbi:hypothetical protein, partial [Candidatus Magnetominusculus xianensis]|uniref:hypothetical protein n=1 Tax=Candidatus Magnetominusculus xianensis TaxID=1748249 RepID=UPI001F3EF681
ESRMREIRLYGSEGGEAKTFPTPIRKASVVAKNIGNSCLIFQMRLPWPLCQSDDNQTETLL